MATVKSRLSAAFVVSVALLASFSILASDCSESADTTYIRNISITIYDQDSSDYGNLAYLSGDLPDSLSAAEWIRDTGNGLWYNVNTNSSDFGRILRYGMVDGITLAEIRIHLKRIGYGLYRKIFIIETVKHTQ